MINPTLTSLASTRPLFLQLPPNVCAHATCLQAIQILFRCFNHHIVELGSLVVGIRAVQSESGHPTFEREDVHNTSTAVRSSRGKEVFPELLPSVFASHEANLVLPLIVAFPTQFSPIGWSGVSCQHLQLLECRAQLHLPANDPVQLQC